MSMCKNCMITGVLSALAASLVTAALLSSNCRSSRNMRNSVNHAMKNLSHAIDDIM